ncbi:MAG: septum formation family protein [Acidimicrobiia bacterium]
MRRASRLVAGLAMVVSACGTSVFSLEVGQCFNDPDLTATEISSVETVDCAEAHDNEIFSSILYLGGGDYPGEGAMAAYAAENCLPEFEAFVGASYSTSVLEFTYLYPSPLSWDDGDREVLCFLYDADLAKLSGSMRGAGI